MSTMKITIKTDGGVRTAKLPFNGAGYVDVEGACPKCGNAPFKVHGLGITSHDYDTYYANAVCDACGDRVGQMRTKVGTLFGIDEDEAVLHGRCRVY